MCAFSEESLESNDQFESWDSVYIQFSGVPGPPIVPAGLFQGARPLQLVRKSDRYFAKVRAVIFTSSGGEGRHLSSPQDRQVGTLIKVFRTSPMLPASKLLYPRRLTGHLVDYARTAKPLLFDMKNQTAFYS